MIHKSICYYLYQYFLLFLFAFCITMNSEAQNNLIIEEIDTMKFFNENSINIEDNTELQSIVINLKWETTPFSVKNIRTKLRC